MFSAECLFITGPCDRDLLCESLLDSPLHHVKQCAAIDERDELFLNLKEKILC